MTENDRAAAGGGSVESEVEPKARGCGWWPTFAGVALAMLAGALALRLESAALAPLHPRPLSMILVGIGVAAGILSAAWAWSSRLRSRLTSGLRSRSTLPSAPWWLPELLFAAAIGVLFMSSVFYSWTKPWPSGYVVHTLVPYSDAGGIYRGALQVLEQGDLDPFNCRRPMTALLLAARLAVTGGDLRLAILIHTAILALAVALLGRTLAVDLGRATAFLVVVILFSAIWWYLPLVMTEPIGMTLGTLGAAALWSGARSRSLPVVLAGIFATALAQTARTSTVFVLPALVLWVLFTFRRKGSRWGLAPAGLACAVILAALLLDGSLRAGYGCGFGVGNGNFSLTLYGFSTGSPGWTKAYEDFPELRQASQEEQNRRAYAESWNNIRRHPGRLVKGLWVGARQAARIGWDFLRFTLAVSFHPLVNGLVLLALASGMLRYAWRTRRRRSTSLMVLCLLGVSVSAPIILPDPESRALAPAFPLIFVPICTALVGWRPGRDATWQRLRQTRRDDAAPSLAVVAVLLAATCLGPGLYRLVRPPLPVASLGADTLDVRLGPKSAHLSVLGPYDPHPTFAPRVRQQELKSFLAHPSAPPGLADGVRSWLDEPFVIILSRRGWIIGPSDLIADRPRLLRLKGKRGTQKYFRFFSVESYVESSDETAGD